MIGSPAFPASLPDPSPLPLLCVRFRGLGSHLRPVYARSVNWAPVRVVLLAAFCAIVVWSVLGCSATVGSSSWALANGFCADASAMGMRVAVGHCGEVEDGGEEDP